MKVLTKEEKKKFVRKKIREITKAMDFCIAKGEKVKGKDQDMYFSIYQLLAYAWNEVGRSCPKHEYEFRIDKEKIIRGNWICTICGKVK